MTAFKDEDLRSVLDNLRLFEDKMGTYLTQKTNIKELCEEIDQVWLNLKQITTLKDCIKVEKSAKCDCCSESTLYDKIKIRHTAQIKRIEPNWWDSNSKK